MGEATGATTFRAPAEAYDRHIGRYGAELRALIDAAASRTGERALDVGCGPGALTTAAGRAARPERRGRRPLAPFAGHAPSGCPASPSRSPPPRRCRSRRPFDAALAQLVVNFMTDPPAGVREMRRVARPGGTIAAAVWDYAAR